jgi:hypothetical protein
MTQTITREQADFLFDEDTKVCVFCDEATDMPYCAGCQEYKGLMTIAEWESYTGETWEE